METRLLTTLRQQQTLSQDQQQSLRLLQMPVMELQGEIELMLEDNPLLEREESDDADAPPQNEAPRESAVTEEDADGDAGSETVEKPIDEPYEIWQGSSGEDSPFDHIAANTSFARNFLPISAVSCLMSAAEPPSPV